VYLTTVTLGRAFRLKTTVTLGPHGHNAMTKIIENSGLIHGHFGSAFTVTLGPRPDKIHGHFGAQTDINCRYVLSRYCLYKEHPPV
jgi:hypothetical protein